MKRFNPETKTFKVFNALYKGAALTQSQAEKRFGVKNLAAESVKAVMLFTQTAVQLAMASQSQSM